MIESLRLNSVLLEMRIAVLAFNCSYAISVLNKILELLTVCGIRLHLWIPTLTIADSKTTIFSRLLRNPRHNKCAEKIYVTLICTRIPRKFCKWNPLRFWNMFEDFFWNPGTYRPEMVRLSSAQFGLVMKCSDIFCVQIVGENAFW